MRADLRGNHVLTEPDVDECDQQHQVRAPIRSVSGPTRTPSALRAVLETYAVLSREKHGSELAELLHRGEHVAHVHQHLHVFLQASLPRPSWREASVPTLPPMNSRSIASTPSPLPAN